MNYQRPLVSIIIPTLNGQDRIESTVNSIVSQSYKNFEIIIFNLLLTTGII